MVYSSFGWLGSWHLVDGAPDGPLEERASWLEKLYRDNRDRLADEWPKPPLLVKALALELAAAFGRTGERLPDSLLWVLSMAMGLPDDFLDDPTNLFAGKDGSGRPLARRTSRDIAMHIEADHRRASGDDIRVQTLQKKIAEVSGAKAPARSTLRLWREDPAYRRDVELMARLGGDRK
jgi:hypothetical protein